MRLTRLVAVLASTVVIVSLQSPGADAKAPAAHKVTSGNIIFAGDAFSHGFIVWQVKPAAEGGGWVSTWSDEPGPGQGAYPRHVRYSPDGIQAAYAVNYDFASGPIVVRDVASGEVLHSFPNIGVQAGAGLDWSPDGSQLVLIAQRSVKILDLASGALTDLYSRPNQIVRLADVTWSPDGRWITFATANDVVNTIKTIHPDGTGGHTIVSQSQTAGEFSDLEWSPDSTRLAYIHTQWDPITVTRTSSDLMTMDKTGAGVVNVSDLAGGPSADRYFTDLAWSPNGVRIAASEQMTNPATSQYFAKVRAYKADGSGKYWLTYDQVTTENTTFDWGRKLS